MNTDVREKIIGMILHDVRKNILFNSNECEMESWEKDPISRLNVYHKYKVIFDSDAERWPDAISSYKQYSCFSFSENNEPQKSKYYFCQSDNFIHYVKNDGSEVKIPADIMTSTESIDILKEHYKYTNDKILNAFYYVSYTIGAFCPVWKNPAAGVRKGENNWYTGNSGRDCVWIKLKKGISESEMLGLENRVNENNLKSRGEDEMFSVCSENNKKGDIINKLYFQDYYNSDGELLRKDINSIYDIKEDLDEFITQLVILIVKRSYRIIMDYRENILRAEDEGIIKEVLGEIGLAIEEK